MVSGMALGGGALYCPHPQHHFPHSSITGTFICCGSPSTRTVIPGGQGLLYSLVELRHVLQVLVHSN